MTIWQFIIWAFKKTKVPPTPSSKRNAYANAMPFVGGGKIQLSTINSQLVMIPHPIAYSFTLHSSKAIAERNNRQVFWLILFRFLPNRVAPYQWIVCERHLGSFWFQVSSFKFQETSYSTTRCGLTAAGLLRILTVFPFESGRYSWYLLFVIQNCAQRYYFFMNYARNWEIFYFIRIHLAISKKNRIFAQRNETQYWLAQLQFIIALCC